MTVSWLIRVAYAGIHPLLHPGRRKGTRMPTKPGDILTIDELSAYLRIPKSTLYKLVRDGRIPSQKVGRHWRFRKRAIDRWLEETRENEPDSAGGH